MVSVEVKDTPKQALKKTKRDMVKYLMRHIKLYLGYEYDIFTPDIDWLYNIYYCICNKIKHPLSTANTLKELVKIDNLIHQYIDEYMQDKGYLN